MGEIDFNKLINFDRWIVGFAHKLPLGETFKDRPKVLKELKDLDFDEKKTNEILAYLDELKLFIDSNIIFRDKLVLGLKQLRLWVINHSESEVLPWLYSIYPNFFELRPDRYTAIGPDQILCVRGNEIIINSFDNNNGGNNDFDEALMFEIKPKYLGMVQSLNKNYEVLTDGINVLIQYTKARSVLDGLGNKSLGLNVNSEGIIEVVEHLDHRHEAILYHYKEEYGYKCGLSLTQIGEKYGDKRKQLIYKYSRTGKDKLKPNILQLTKVIPYLSGYPAAQKAAINDLEQLKANRY